MVGLVALALILRQAPNTDVRIRYENAGANAKIVLADVSKLARVQLETAPETAGEILAIRTDGQPLAELMKHIAWAVDGEWQAQGEGYRLIRTPLRQQQEEDRELASKAAEFRAAIDKMRKAVDEQPDFTPDAATKVAGKLRDVIKAFTPNSYSPAVFQRQAELSAAQPSGRAIARLAALLDPVDLAKLPSQLKVVYSTAPTATQRPLGEEAQAVIRQFVREQAVWSDAATKLDLADPTQGSMTFYIGGGPTYTDRLEESDIGCALLTVSKWSDDYAGAQLELQIADRKGKVLTSRNGSISSGYWNSTGAGSEKPPANPAPAQYIEVPKDLADAATALSWQQNPKSVPGDLRALLLHPERYEPLGLTIGRLLTLCARSEGRPLVANLSDTMLQSQFNHLRFDPRRFVQDFAKGVAEREEQEDWLALRPRTMARNRTVRVDRGALGRYVRRWAEKPAPSIDEQAAFCLELPEQSANSMSELYRTTMCGFVGNTPDERILRFYAQLDSVQKSTALQRKLRMDSLGPGASAALGRILYGPWIYLNLNQQGSLASQNDVNLFYNGIFKEPTECLPNGPPPDGTVKIDVTTSQVAAPPSQINQGVFFGAMGANELAWQKFCQSRPGMFPWMADLAQQAPLKRLQFGTRTQYLFTFQFTPQISYGNSIESCDYGDGALKDYADLPEEFRKEVDSQYANFEQSYKDAKPGQFGNPQVPTHISPPPH